MAHLRTVTFEEFKEGSKKDPTIVQVRARLECRCRLYNPERSVLIQLLLAAQALSLYDGLV